MNFPALIRVMSESETSYAAHRKELELILLDHACDEEVRKVVSKALKSLHAFELVKETELYDRLDKTGDIEVREELVEYFSSFAITGAWRYKDYGVPMLDLISAGHRGIVAAAYAFSARKGRTFYPIARNAIELCILDKLDHCGVEQVSPDEVVRLIREGDSESADEIMTLLNTLERQAIIRVFGPSAESLADVRKHRMPSVFDKEFNMALRKLRRRKN